MNFPALLSFSKTSTLIKQEFSKQRVEVIEGDDVGMERVREVMEGRGGVGVGIRHMLKLGRE